MLPRISKQLHKWHSDGEDKGHDDFIDDLKDAAELIDEVWGKETTNERPELVFLAVIAKRLGR